MSHFPVVVIGGNVEEQLAPYNENTEVDPYPVDMDEEELQRMTEYYNKEESTQHSLEGLLRHLDDWNGHGDTGPGPSIVDALWGKTIRYYKTYNPDSKWDWYEVGGRWMGFFMLKPGADGHLGVPGVFGNEASPGTADVLKAKDIDFKAMRNEAARKANSYFDLLEQVLGHLDLSEYQSWEEVRGENSNVEFARKVYGGQEAVQALDKATFKDKLPLSWDETPDTYLRGREAFVAAAIEHAGVPYAIVRDGKWVARGDMGWWGISTNEVEQDSWNHAVQELYDSLPPDTVITVVDCHI